MRLPLQASHPLLYRTKPRNSLDGKKQMGRDSGQDDRPLTCFDRWPLVQPWTGYQLEQRVPIIRQSILDSWISRRTCGKTEALLYLGPSGVVL